MPLSMRRQTLKIKRRAQKEAERSLKRYDAVELLKHNQHTLREIQNITGVPKSTVGELKKLLHAEDFDNLNRKLEGISDKGRNTVLTEEEEKMIVGRLLFASSRGFALGVESVKDMISRVAADGRSGWRNGVPSDAAVRAFRARHRELTLRKSERKDHAKLNADFDHVKRFFKIMEEVETKNKGILSNPNRIVNMDETRVDATFGKREKAFTASSSHHGGFRGEQTVYGARQHVTAVVMATASGRVAPPFFIVGAKRLNRRWWAPVKGKFGGNVSGICAKFTQPNWFPQDGVIKVADNGSMEKPLLVAAVKHMNKFVRRFAKEESYVLCLDGHSSRKGTEWIEECSINNCEVVLKPANTSHFLQACDQDINKRFKNAMRELRDAFRRLGMVDTRQVNFNLACAVYAYESITSTDVTEAFKATGVYPFQKDFANRFRTNEDEQRQIADIENAKFAQGGPSSSVISIRKRRSDMETLQQATKIVSRNLGPSKTLQELSIILRNAETVNNILLSAGPSGTASTAESTNTKRVQTIGPGAPAECLTLPEVLERRRQQEAKELQEEKDRKQRKLERETNRALRAEAEGRKREKKVADAAAKASANEAKKLAAELGRAAARAQRAGWKRRRGIKRDAEGREKKPPSLRSYQFAALIVHQAVLAAVNTSVTRDSVRA